MTSILSSAAPARAASKEMQVAEFHWVNLDFVDRSGSHSLGVCWSHPTPSVFSRPTWQKSPGFRTI